MNYCDLTYCHPFKSKVLLLVLKLVKDLTKQYVQHCKIFCQEDIVTAVTKLLALALMRICPLPSYASMDEGTLKTPIPQCRLYWSFLFGVVKQFCRF
jgi:hypothetical protein